MARLILAPMHGLADDVLRAVLTRVGRYDHCVSEFVRVAGSVLPGRSFQRVAPELLQGSKTDNGTPVRVQLLGSDPERLAASAANLVACGPAGVDLNFGCPAPTVNRHRGGAVLLDEPELLHRICLSVRRQVPSGIPFTAKMRLGVQDPSRAVECAQALAAGGVDELVVHGRTKVDGYRPPARWAWIGRVREAVSIPVIANGEIWTTADYHACRSETGCDDVMLGRGAVADPFLVQRIRGEEPGDWESLIPAIEDFWRRVTAKVEPAHCPGRLKLWLGYMRPAYPQAERLYQAVRQTRTTADVAAVFAQAGILASMAKAA